MPVPSERDKKSGQFKPDLRLRQPRFRERARRLYVDHGLSLRKVGDKLGLPLPQIQWLVNDLGVMRKRTHRIDEMIKQADKVEKLYVIDLLTLDEIARLYGVEKHQVSALLKQLGIPLRMGASTRHFKSWNDYLTVDIMTLTYNDYVWYVRRLSAAVMHRYGVYLDPENKQSRAWHIDHIYSIHQGWWIWSKQNGEFIPRARPMPLTKICHPANLRLIAGRQNAMKGIYCAHDAVTLGKRIVEFEREHGKVFNGK